MAMYSGNLGLAHSFDEFLEAARRLRDRDDLVFLFVGAGPRLEEVRAARDREELDQRPVARLRSRATQLHPRSRWPTFT